MSGAIRKLFFETDVQKPLKLFVGWKGFVRVFFFIVGSLLFLFFFGSFVYESGSLSHKFGEAVLDVGKQWRLILLAGIVVAVYARIDQDWTDRLGKL